MSPQSDQELLARRKALCGYEPRKRQRDRSRFSSVADAFPLFDGLRSAHAVLHCSSIYILTVRGKIVGECELGQAS